MNRMVLVEKVRDELREIAGHRNALDGRLVDQAIWLLSHDEWTGEGLHKPEQFLAWRCGITTGAARRYVQVAERADQLPKSVDALRRGEISMDQLMPIVRNVPAWADEQVLSLAHRLTPTQVRRLTEQYDFASAGPIDDHDAEQQPLGDDSATTEMGPEPEAGTTTAETETAPPDATIDGGSGVEPEDRSWMGVGDDGRFRLFIECTPELGDTIRSAVAEVRDHEFRTSGNLISDAEALAIVAQRSLDTVDDATRRDRFRTLVHLHADGTPVDAHGRRLPDAVTRHITCEGLLTPVFVESGIPISVGRSQRIVPDRTRRVVIQRDGGCRVPGCGATHHLEVHHIVHWADDGPTDTWNLVALCSHHHRLHHHGRLDITGNADRADGLTFTNQHGTVMNRDGPDPTPPTGPPPRPACDFTGPLGERLEHRWVDIRHPDRLHPALRNSRRNC